MREEENLEAAHQALSKTLKQALEYEEAEKDKLKVLLQTFSIMGKSISQLELAQADVVVRPALPDVGSAEFSARKKSIEAGRAAMKQALPQLKALMAP